MLDFFLKKVVSRCIFPIPISLEFLLAGLFLLWFTRRQRAGKVLVSCGTILLILFSSGVIADPALHWLEHRYPALSVGNAPAGIPGMSYIAVLGGAANHDPEVPLSSRLSPNLLVRLVEGVRLYREFTGAKLIVSGDNDSADDMAKMGQALGVRPEDIIKLPRPNDTDQESQQIGHIVGAQRFVLVTSAGHMPRAVASFHKRGLQPIPAPTNYLIVRHTLGVDDFLPDAVKITETEAAVYEYLALAWRVLRGRT